MVNSKDERSVSFEKSRETSASVSVRLGFGVMGQVWVPWRGSMKQ